MGKRIIRLRRNELNEEALKPWVGSIADIVTNQNTTHHGKILRLHNSTVVVEDLNKKWYNRKKHQHPFKFDDITEVTLTTWAPY